MGVPTAVAESVRARLAAAGWLDTSLVPGREDGRVWFAVSGAAAREDVQARLRDVPTARIAPHRFEARPLRTRSYQDLLVDLPAEARGLLPSSFDIVGHVALLKLDEALLPHAAAIAAAVLSAQPRVETVALDAGVEGERRVRGLTVIGGDPRLATLHREHGLEIEVDLATTYFSPRLATERKRLAERIAPGSRVLDLFAGAGAFVCLVARDRAPSAVLAIDINPHAIEALRANLVRNRIAPSVVGAVVGDARAVAPRTRDWDHVVMNLPHGAFDFLDVAAGCVARGGEVHLYAMVERADADAFGARAADRLAAATGTAWRVAEVRHVRSYAPTMDGLGFTLAEVKP